MSESMWPMGVGAVAKSGRLSPMTQHAVFCTRSRDVSDGGEGGLP